MLIKSSSLNRRGKYQVQAMIVVVWLAAWKLLALRNCREIEKKSSFVRNWSVLSNRERERKRGQGQVYSELCTVLAKNPHPARHHRVPSLLLSLCTSCTCPVKIHEYKPTTWDLDPSTRTTIDDASFLVLQSRFPPHGFTVDPIASPSNGRCDRFFSLSGIAGYGCLFCQLVGQMSLCLPSHRKNDCCLEENLIFIQRQGRYHLSCLEIGYFLAGIFPWRVPFFMARSVRPTLRPFYQARPILRRCHERKKWLPLHCHLFRYFVLCSTIFFPLSAFNMQLLLKFLLSCFIAKYIILFCYFLWLPFSFI